MGGVSVRLAIMCGLPRSGKTTFARKLQARGWARLCPDDVRIALHGQAFIASAESFVWATVELAARSLLLADHSVVIDATNTTRKRRAQWVNLAKEFEIPLEVFVVSTQVQECHARNKANLPSLPSTVIDRMAEQWEPVEEEGVRIVMVEQV